MYGIPESQQKHRYQSNRAELDNKGKNVNFHHLLEKVVAELLSQAKDLAAKKRFKFVWFAHSTILTRKSEDSEVIKIHSSKDLKLIK